MFAMALDRSFGDAGECPVVSGPAARTALPYVLPQVHYRVAGERQPPLPLLDTGARPGEEAAEKYPGRAVQYPDQLGDHRRPARGGADLLEAAVGPPQS